MPSSYDPWAPYAGSGRLDIDERTTGPQPGSGFEGPEFGQIDASSIAQIVGAVGNIFLPAKQAAPAPVAPQSSGMGQYLPWLLIGGGVLLVVLLTRK